MALWGEGRIRLNSNACEFDLKMSKVPILVVSFFADVHSVFVAQLMGALSAISISDTAHFIPISYLSFQ